MIITFTRDCVRAYVPSVVRCLPSLYGCREHDQESRSLAFVIAGITAPRHGIDQER